MSNATQFPTVYIQPLALEKLRLYCKHAGHQEISGLGIARADEGEIVVDDVFLFEQEVTSGDTELNAEALAKWDYEIRKANGDPTLYRLWWHKHPINGWSGTDEKNIEGLNNGEWLLSIAHTPNGWQCRLDTYKPFRVTMDSLTLLELTPPNYELDKALEEEVKQKVKTKVYGTTVWVGNKQTAWDRDPMSGAWIRKDQKKEPLAIPGTVAPSTASTTDTVDDTGHDAFFEALADHDWEDYYDWNAKEFGDEKMRARLYGRSHS